MRRGLKYLVAPATLLAVTVRVSYPRARGCPGAPVQRPIQLQGNPTPEHRDRAEQTQFSLGPLRIIGLEPLEAWHMTCTSRLTRT